MVDLEKAKRLSYVLDVTRGNGWADGDVIRDLIADYEKLTKKLEKLKKKKKKLAS